MDKSHAAKQEQSIANQDRSKRRQADFGERPSRLANVPKGMPASESWHVERRLVMEGALDPFRTAVPFWGQTT